MNKRDKDKHEEALRRARESLNQSGETLRQGEKAKEKVGTGSGDRDDPGFSEGVIDDLVDDIKTTVKVARQIRKFFNHAADVYRTVRKYAGPVATVLEVPYRAAKHTFMWAAFEREDGDLKLDDKKKPMYSWLGKAFKTVVGEMNTQKLGWDSLYQFEPTRFKRDEDGDLIFNKFRLGKVAGSAMAAIMALNIAAHGAYYYGTQFDEYILANGGKQTIEDATTFQFTGCTSAPCDTEADNGKFYRINYSWFWPRMIYPETQVYSLVPENNGLCHVKGHGIYFRSAIFRVLYKNFSSLYQNVEAVSCVPITDTQIQDILEHGESLEAAWHKMHGKFEKSFEQNLKNTSSLIAPEYLAPIAGLNS